MKTVLIADENRRLGELMGQLLDDDERFRVVGVVSTQAAALRCAKEHQPDVVLVSYVMNGALGTALCSALRAMSPGSALLLWTHDVEGTQAADPDVDGVIERGMTYRDLARAIRLATPARHGLLQVVDLVQRAEERQR